MEYGVSLDRRHGVSHLPHMRPALRSYLLSLWIVFPLAWGLAAGAVVSEPEEPVLVLEDLTLEEKLAQMFIAGVPPTQSVVPVRAGGIIFLGGQLRDVDTVAQRVASLQQRSEIPLLIVADVEGGKVNRLNRHPDLEDMPTAAALSVAGAETARHWGRRAGRVMGELGLNCNLAPVLDLASQGHMHQQQRSFGDDPVVVAKIAGAFAEGLAQEGVVAIGKHYPGYGPSMANSDHALVIEPRPSDLFERHERAFELMGDRMAGVMMTNIGFNEYGEVPASFSPTLVTLAHEKGWLTMTDDLAIPALAESAGGDSLAVVRQAFLAGNDLLLTTWPLEAEGAPDYVGELAALVRSTPGLEQRVDESVQRILNTKRQMGLIPGGSEDR